MPDPKLYVIFRGNWAFLQTPANIVVKTPDMGDDHDYQAGNLDDLQAIRRGSLLRVTGVDQICTPGTTTVDTKKHPVIQNTRLGASEECTSVTTIILPKPANIFPLYQLRIPRKNLQCSGKHDVSQISQSSTDPIVACLTYVFEYSFTGENVPKIEGMKCWKLNPWTDSDSNTVVATLHFRAEPSYSVGKDHSATEFRFATLLLDDDISIDPKDCEDGDDGLIPDLLRSVEAEQLGRLRIAAPLEGGRPRTHFVSDNPTCLPAFGDGRC